MSRTAGLPRALGLFACVCAMSPTAVDAQGRFTFQPFLSMAAIHDSDVFSTIERPRADVVTRLTPGTEAAFDSPLTTVGARYSVDLERFTHHPELTSMHARQHGTATIAYRATPVFSVLADGEFLTTRRPEELTLTTGLAVTRARATRAAARASVTRRFDAVTSGTFGYSFGHDRLGRSFAIRTQAVDAGLTRQVSARTSVRGGYRAEVFQFAAAKARNRVASHAIRIGASHAIGPRLRASFDVGPRLTGSVLGPEIDASIAGECADLNLSVAYEQTQTTVIGLAGAADVRRVSVTAARRVSRSLEIALAPSIFRTALGDARADVYSVGLNLVRRLTGYLALDVTFQGGIQRGNVYPGAAFRTIPRHTLTMRLVAGPAARPGGDN